MGMSQQLAASMPQFCILILLTGILLAVECETVTECGRSAKLEKRIIGGTETSITKFPFFAGVKIFGYQICAGALINKCYVLTCAHCYKWLLTPMFTVQAVLGTDEREDPSRVEINVKEIITHPLYLPTQVHHDLAILKLESPVNFTNKIFPICLPVKDQNYTGQMATVLGFGSSLPGGLPSKHLQAVDLEIRNNSVCSERYRGNATVYESNLCAGGMSGKDSCSGDSGGPLVMKMEDIYEIIGTVSWGQGCGQEGYPGVYTHIGFYESWIRNVTSDPECY